MLERTFTYTGFDGKEHKDTWCFYLSKADILEIHLGTYVGLDVLIQRLIDAQNGKEIMAIIKEIILKSVGHPSADGRRFIRNQEIRDEFEQTEAFSELFEELILDSDKALEFVASVVPAEMGKYMRATKAENEDSEDVASDNSSGTTTVVPIK